MVSTEVLHSIGLFRSLSIAANQMSQQMGQLAPGAGAQMFGPGSDPDKQFRGEAENLAVLAHRYTLEGVEQRLLEHVKI